MQETPNGAGNFALIVPLLKNIFHSRVSSVIAWSMVLFAAVSSGMITAAAYPEISQGSAVELAAKHVVPKVLGLSNLTPVGFIDEVTADGTVRGWAYDPNGPSKAIDVHFYIDFPAGQAAPSGFVKANQIRPDVNTTLGIAGNHGFSWPVPEIFKDGNRHVIYAYGIDSSGADSANVLLSNAPKVFTVFLIDSFVGDTAKQVTGLTAVDSGTGGRILLTWNETPEDLGAGSFRIYRKAAGFASFEYVYSVEGNVFEDRELVNSATYTYVVVPATLNGPEFYGPALAQQSASANPTASQNPRIDRLLFVVEQQYWAANPQLKDDLNKTILQLNAIYQKNTNKQFALAGISAYDAQEDCDYSLSEPCKRIFNDKHFVMPGAITVFSGKFNLPGAQGLLYAFPNLRVIIDSCSSVIPNLGPDGKLWACNWSKATDWQAGLLAHELGHAFGLGLPEYYAYRDKTDQTGANPIWSGELIPDGYRLDPMYSPTVMSASELRFGPLSSTIINGNLSHAQPEDDYKTYRKMFPRQVRVRVTDDKFAPVAGASVKVFCIAGSSLGNQLAEAAPRFVFTTDINGNALLQEFSEVEPGIFLPINRGILDYECVVQLLKVYKDGYEPTVVPVTDLQLQEAKVLQGQEDYVIPINLVLSAVSATFVKTDTYTQGNWKGEYGADGYLIATGYSAYPSKASVAQVGSTPFLWASDTSDDRALQKPDGSGRIAGTWYSWTNFYLDVNMQSDTPQQVALYLLDYDSTVRGETIEVLNADTGVVLDRREVSSFHEGKYLVWNIKGRVKFNFLHTGGSNAVLSGIFFGGGENAVFIKADTVTQGNWKGVYGQEGYMIVNDASIFSSGIEVFQQGAKPFTWADDTADARALQKIMTGVISDAPSRIASTWYAPNNFVIDVKFIDAQTHQVALYFLDYDSTTRSEIIEVSDVLRGTVLDSRQVESFHDGEYWVWNVKGHVRFRITASGSGNAVVSGVFIDPSVKWVVE